MQKEWASFKITLLLYFIVLILPFGFYFIYTSFQTMQSDTKAVHQVGWIGGAISKLALKPSEQDNQQTIKRIDRSLQEISLWVTQNSDSELYIGADTLAKDFSQVQSSWDRYKQKFSKHDNDAMKKQLIADGHLIDDFSIVVQKMVYLKQNKIINMFYFTLIVIMILMLVSIYLIRTYIQHQIKKHAIYDHDTKLFNKQYFLSELKTSCARSVRYKSPLSILSISIDDFGKGSEGYDEKTKEHILGMLGGLITSLTRTSDVACRYDEDHFSILLPDTEEENALILERRVREVFEKHDFMTKPELKFRFSTVPFNYEETAEAFITHTEGLLK